MHSLWLFAFLAADLTPPVAPRKPHVETLHGEKRSDDWFWLREKENPEVRRYLEAENAYAEGIMKPLAPLRDQLYQEMLGRLKQTDMDVPYGKGGYLYYTRTEQGKQYPIRCRKKGAESAPEQVLLDVNQLAKGERFMAIGDFEPSDDAQQLAYTTDNTGYRQYRLFVKDLRSGATTAALAERVGSVAWARDNRTLFYTVEDDAKRQYRLYRHRLGSNQHDLLYEEKDERFNVAVGRTRSGAWLVLTIESHTTAEARVLPADQPDTSWRLIQPRVPNHEYYVDHRDDRFFIRTNDRGRNFRLVSAPVADPGQANWREELPHRPAVMLQDVHVFARHILCFERENGLPHLHILAARPHRVPVAEPVYHIAPGQNEEFDTNTVRYGYQSFTTPASVYDYDVATRRAVLRKRQEVLGKFSPGDYQAERIWATAKDGTRIPISLVYKKGLKRDGQAAMLLSGYGSYGISRPVMFSLPNLSLLDRGVVYAIAHIRGGGEMGKAWHDQGRMGNKKNTFTDFIACAEHLIAQKYTSTPKLVIEGGSAGGLLMGAVVNLRPDLFKAVIAHVPFVDVINTMLDESLPLTVGEFEEWGNPKNQKDYAYMKTYCPYSNLDRRGFPAMLVKTSLDDSQVSYHEPAKYVAKLRTVKTDQNPLLFVCNMAGGHGGSSGRYDRLKETAFDYAFLLWQVGLAKL